MRRILLGILLLACAKPSGHGAASAIMATAGPRDETLRSDLLTRAEADQSARLALMRKQQQGLTPDSLDIARMIEVDEANTAWLRRVLAVRGWPGKTLVGADGADAAFLFIQHADRDTAFQAAVLPLLEQAFAAGEASGQHFALLTDRVATARRQPQIYGSQADIVAGHVVLKPIADSAGVDARRARVGLPPLAEYVRVLDSLYAPRKSP
ncbi:MAG TPA: DUF6624 domain-containing protein [Gemmatimonadaceae bacterium]|jgi:hypothetical protein